MVEDSVPKTLKDDSSTMAEDEVRNTVNETSKEAKPMESTSDSGNSKATAPINKHLEAEGRATVDEKANHDKKRTLAQVYQNEAGNDDEPEGPKIKKAKVAAARADAMTSLIIPAKGSVDASPKKSIFPFTPVTFSGPTVILVFGWSTRYEISIHENLLRLHGFFSDKIDATKPEPNGQTYLSFMGTPKIAGILLRGYLYHSKLPWYGKDIAAMKSTRASKACAKIISTYVLAMTARMPALCYQLCNLCSNFRWSEFDVAGLETVFELLDMWLEDHDMLKTYIEEKVRMAVWDLKHPHMAKAIAAKNQPAKLEPLKPFRDSSWTAPKIHHPLELGLAVRSHENKCKEAMDRTIISVNAAAGRSKGSPLPLLKSGNVAIVRDPGYKKPRHLLQDFSLRG